jgi:hypothetical protein
MIQPQELRIGNYLEWSNHDNYSEVKPITGKDIEEIEYNHMHPDDPEERNRFHSSWDYVPITPEILERLGFDKHPHFTVANSRFIELGRNRVLSVQCAGTPNEIVFLSEQSDKAVKDVICIRNYDYDGYTYVHQLQNLYHSLTGIELTFKTN